MWRAPFIASLSLLLLLTACPPPASPGGSGGTTGGGGTSGPALLDSPFTFKQENLPQNIDTCSFTYSTQNLASPGFLATFANYNTWSNYIAFRRSEANADLQIYETLFNANYDDYIAESSLVAYDIKSPESSQDDLDSDMLATQIASSTFLNDPSVPATPPRHTTMWSHQLKYLVARNRAYIYNTNQAYVNFANQFIGGGVMTHGKAQEEVMLLESNFLPVVAQVRLQQLINATQNGKLVSNIYWNQTRNITLPGCTSPSYTNLAQIPTVTKMRMINKYSKTGITVLTSPVDIYMTAMAAINFTDSQSGGQYTQDNLRKMTLLATQAFYNTFKVLAANGEKTFHIHTGHWGAGVFKGSQKTAFAMQFAAFLTAYEMYKELTVDSSPLAYLQYAAFNDSGYNTVLGAITDLKAKATPDGSLEDFITTIYELTQSDTSWQVGGTSK